MAGVLNIQCARSRMDMGRWRASGQGHLTPTRWKARHGCRRRDLAEQGSGVLAARSN